MRGSKPTPDPDKAARYAAVRLAGGTDVEGTNGDDAKPASSGPEIHFIQCPDYFDDTAREAWVFLLEHLQRAELFQKLDVFKLELLCVAVSDYRHYRRALEGMDHRGVYETRGRNGWQRKSRPEYQRMRDAAADIAKIGSDFGLDPVARHRLNVLPQESEQLDLLGDGTG